MASSKHVSRTDSQATLRGHYIPEDLIMNILSRLPAKSIPRLKTVSKAWLSMISNPTFVDLHLRHASENNDSLLFHRVFGSFNSVSLCRIDSSIKLPYFEGNLWGDLSKKKNLWGDLFIVGSCNGIVCAALKNQPGTCVFRERLLITFSSPHFSCSSNFHIYLWNPVTEQSKLLPTPQSTPDYSKVYVGFGFDPTINDFKVVRISYNKYMDAMVYSSNTNAWKNIESPPILPINSIADICVKGFLYWTCADGVVSFNLIDEVFSYHKFPANVQKTIHLSHDFRDCMKIIEMKDSIDVAMCSYDGRTRTKLNVWTMNDGFEGSWTLKFSFDVPQPVDWLHGNLHNSGKILYKSIHRVWRLYNSDKKETETVKLDDCETFEHTESLVSIRGSERLSEMLAKLKMDLAIAKNAT